MYGMNGHPLTFAYCQLTRGKEDRTNEWRWLIPKCPFCGKEHKHSGGLTVDNPRAQLGHRVAHCESGETRGEYILLEGAEYMDANDDLIQAVRTGQELVRPSGWMLRDLPYVFKHLWLLAEDFGYQAAATGDILSLGRAHVLQIALLPSRPVTHDSVEELFTNIVKLFDAGPTSLEQTDSGQSATLTLRNGRRVKIEIRNCAAQIA